jgi:hypothetical protein
MADDISAFASCWDYSRDVPVPAKCNECGCHPGDHWRGKAKGYGACHSCESCSGLR